MNNAVLIMATLDTKGAEVAYIKGQIEKRERKLWFWT